MAVIPLLPKEEIALVLANMRIARAHGMSRNMAIPTTYLWFYQNDPHDQFWIRQGIEYAKKYGY
ncbi:hypothetical protein [Enterobacter chengduensis]|uniref:hypothetical protein n=1 Tax=Enterobacter chengduensis TaxID=2494701 RepID=UPI0020050B59|nr:hypothetical protein [Enterobacter chengduensis]MCK7450182.1 hypothetical protein [Enterobacter chengduensis]